MWEILAGLALGCVMSGVVPLVNAELLVIAAAVAVPAPGLPLVVIVATAGQMLSKTMLFELARRAPRRLPERARGALDRAVDRVRERGGAAGTLVFASAASGIPPFYGVSLAGGALGMRVQTFLLTGTAGRGLRFAVLAWAAHAVGGTP
jgi:membrane protein YqaA with SNARE-associated domain